MESNREILVYNIRSWLNLDTRLKELQKQIKAIPESQKIIIDGMTCSHCESSVEQALLKLENIQSVSANHKTGENRLRRL